ncbi:MAG: iron-containing alcohol dehydrogenase [Clostridia bacterium]|nr:iron-containing alcohol dehydrogenase [Clostridia bacterium]
MDSMRAKKRTLKDAEIYIGDGLIGQIVSCFNHRFSEGALCLIYDRNVSGVADDIIKELKSSGYRVFVQAVSSLRHGNTEKCDSVPEYVRHVFAVGAGTAANAAKEIASKLDVEWTMFLTAPSTDTIMCDNAPKMVFIDGKVLGKCPSSCIAAGYGILLSQPLAAFESFFASKVLAKPSALKLVQPQTNIELCELAYSLLEISVDRRVDSAQIMSELMYASALDSGKRPRLIGEYKFLCGALIAAFYSAYLGAPSIDVMPPACREVAADIIDNLGYEPKRGKRVDFFDVNVYFRISYILSEYRTDLLDKLGSIDFRTAQRFWRRLYPDAGYWLKSEITCRDLLSGLTLAGSLSESLLGFAYASGVTAKI